MQSAQQPVEYEPDNLAIEESYAYNLWDADISQACKCDATYFGPDCSLRKCRYGTDPLYFHKAENTIVQTAVVHLGSKGSTQGRIGGTFKIVFYDAFGEAYTTRPIDAAYTTTTPDKVRFALEAIPNGVISTPTTDTTKSPPAAVAVSMADPAGDIETSGAVGAGTMGAKGAGLGTRGGQSPSGSEFTITFSHNPGLLKSIEIDTRQVTNPGETDYWTASARVGQFKTRYTTMVDRVESLIYGSKRLMTANDLSHWAPVHSMVKIGRQEFNVDAINHYQATLSEPYLGPSIVPTKILLDSGGVIVTSITDADGDGDYDTLTFASALVSMSQVNSLLSGASIMVGGCPMKSSDWEVIIGDTTMTVEDDHDCHPDILSDDPKLYRTSVDPDMQDIFVAESDTYSTTLGLATTRGSADVYVVEPMLDNAATPGQLFVGAYTSGAAAKFTVHSGNSAGASVLAQDTPIFVNTLGPILVDAAVTAGGTELSTAGDDATSLDHIGSSVTGVKWPVMKVISDPNLAGAEGKIIGINGRRYKIASVGATGGVANSKITLTEVVAGGMLVKLCDHCVVSSAGSGTLLTLAQRVTLKTGDQVAIGGYVNEDHLYTVTSNTYSDETCTSQTGAGPARPWTWR